MVKYTFCGFENDIYSYRIGGIMKHLTNSRNGHNALLINTTNTILKFLIYLKIIKGQKQLMGPLL